jgi:oxygen-independent coproporphyrinogen-3 oxidase
VPEADYITSLITEVELLSVEYGLQDKEISSIFYGGGTPSLLSGEALTRLHEALSRTFTIEWDKLEVSLEANPQDITAQYANDLRGAGINRVSLGVQSLSPTILTLLGREHTPDDVKHALTRLKEATFENINMDLIFGTPEHSQEVLTRDIESFIVLHPSHISTYSLTIERGTPFFQAVASGTFTPPADKLVRDQYELIMNSLPEFGFYQYEVSNFARPGFQCVHNKQYWTRESYLGLGPGAHSFLKEKNIRWANVRRPDEYRAQLAGKHLPTAWSEHLTREDAISEMLMLGLRRTDGLTLIEPFSLLSAREAERLSHRLEALEDEGLGSYNQEKERFSLTNDGLCVADSIISDLIASTIETSETTDD